MEASRSGCSDATLTELRERFDDDNNQLELTGQRLNT